MDVSCRVGDKVSIIIIVSRKGVFSLFLSTLAVVFVNLMCCVQAGQTVPMSSLLLADPTKSYFKLSLWRQAAVWVERISAGDVIYFRSNLAFNCLCMII